MEKWSNGVAPLLELNRGGRRQDSANTTHHSISPLLHYSVLQPFIGFFDLMTTFLLTMRTNSGITSDVC